MVITIKKIKEKTRCNVYDIVVGGTFKYGGDYFLKVNDKDDDEDPMMIYIDLLTGRAVDITPTSKITPINLIMQEEEING